MIFYVSSIVSRPFNPAQCMLFYISDKVTGPFYLATIFILLCSCYSFLSLWPRPNVCYSMFMSKYPAPFIARNDMLFDCMRMQCADGLALAYLATDENLTAVDENFIPKFSGRHRGMSEAVSQYLRTFRICLRTFSMSGYKLVTILSPQNTYPVAAMPLCLLFMSASL